MVGNILNFNVTLSYVEYDLYFSSYDLYIKKNFWNINTLWNIKVRSLYSYFSQYLPEHTEIRTTPYDSISCIVGIKNPIRCIYWKRHTRERNSQFCFFYFKNRFANTFDTWRNSSPKLITKIYVSQKLNWSIPLYENFSVYE